MLVERKACFHVANAFLSLLKLNLAHFQAENLLKKRVWQKEP